MLARGLQGRLLADPGFAYKMAVQLGLDAAIIVGVNYWGGRAKFWREIEFTICQLSISLMSDFALVYLLAPTAFVAPAAPGSLAAALARLPAYAFMPSPPGGPAFSLGQRCAALAFKGLQYGAVGVAMGALGTACVHGLLALRERSDPNFQPPARVQSVAGVATLWAAYMATSANLRFNAVNLAEELLFGMSPAAGRAGSIALRLANNWAGAAQWVWLCNQPRLDISQPWEGRKLKAAAQ